MTDLEKLYASIRNLEELGLELDQGLLQDVDDLEEKLIKTEILPALSKDILPRLSPVERELVLVVEYKPGDPISVSLSRKTNVTKLIEAKKIVSDDPLLNDPSPVKYKHHKKSPKTGLCVFLNEEDFIQKSSAVDTFAQAIAVAGVKRVRELGIIRCGINLVSDVKHKKKKYAQSQRKKDGFYIVTNMSNLEKKKILEKISKALSLNWRVEIVK